MMTTNKATETNHTKRTLGLYIHVPFCERKCSYCGFLSFTGHSNGDLAAYASALRRELVLVASANGKGSGRTVDTVFFGGGTPSLLPGDEITLIMEKIHGLFDVSPDLEATLEANPGTLDLAKLEAYRDAGINRISLGIQSFDDAVLQSIGRIHDSRKALNSVDMVRKAGFSNLSLDLMFGLPGQTLETWLDSLKIAAELDPEHLSLYALQLEEGTPLYLDYKSERVPQVPTTLERRMYHEGSAFLQKRGYHRYEISNFAKPGADCRHNLKYWEMGEFLGAGPGACSFLDGNRWKNLESIEDWKDAIALGRLGVDNNTLSSDSIRDRAGIFVFTGLRKAAGIRFADFRRQVGEDFDAVFPEARTMLEACEREGLVAFEPGTQAGFRLTDAGIDRSNEIMSEFV